MSRAKLLVVDDEADIRTLLNHSLRASYDIEEAGDAVEAAAVVRRTQIDLVLLDVMMPGASGLQACRELKRLAEPRLLPVLLLTALDDAENRTRGLEAGADDYLTKPIDRRQLELRVAHYVDLAREDQRRRDHLEALTGLAAMKDDLSTLLVHDLRNPLSAVLAALVLIERTTDDAAVKDLVSIARDGASRVWDSVDDLLKVRLLEEQRLPLALVVLELEPMVREGLRAVEPLLTDRKVKASVHIAGAPRAALDVSLLRRSLDNLLVNAIRHTVGAIEVRVTQADGKVVLSIADHGAGVPEALKAGLFEKFGSVAMHKAGARRGHGLGLYMVKLVAEAHGGSVSVGDRVGGGAEFRITLPAA